MGWMTCEFTSSSIIFLSYQEDVRMIIKDVCNRTRFTTETISLRGCMCVCVWGGGGGGGSTRDR